MEGWEALAVDLFYFLFFIFYLLFLCFLYLNIISTYNDG